MQFSIEAGGAGLDRCLIAPANIEDAHRFTGLAHAPGHDVSERSENGVRYLRVACRDLAMLCRHLLTDICGATYDSEFDMRAEGVRWTGDDPH
ncbi:MAG TPA: hypothetical protein VHI13_12070 [Candidatus Kapabacteria bacterium]|nr:hypothetical protein [Candidatus Kapabacteria bacterium]